MKNGGGRRKLYINSAIAPSDPQGDRIRRRETRQTIGTPSGTILGTGSTPQHGGVRKSGN